MTDQARRKVLRAEYEQTPPAAGVYRVVNRETGRSLVGSTTNLGSVAGKLAFAKSTKKPGLFFRRLHADIAQFGIEAFELEILETLTPRPVMTAHEVEQDLATLEALWREKLGPEALY
jgi:hypothetical protein